VTVTRGRVIVAVFVVAIIAAAALAPKLLRQLSFFRVRQIEVVGTQYLDEADVVRLMALRPNASTFDPLAPVSAAARAIPGVLSATVERRLPATLRIAIHEARPVALLDGGDKLILMDSVGKPLPFDPTRVPTVLPIAAKDSAVAGLLARVRRDDRALFDGIDAARIDHGDVVLEIGPRRIRLRPESDAAVLEAVSVVISYLNTSGIAWREIDARYRSRVFVQKGTA
jgi:POTRA domain, FtsQ-type